MMEFTTPHSYGTTTVNVSGLATDGALLAAGARGTALRRDIVEDTEAGWPEPTAATFKWTDASAHTTAELAAPLGRRVDRVDIMAEVPKFVKTIVAGAAGTRPYIYQYIINDALAVTQAGETSQVKGKTFIECTQISA